MYDAHCALVWALNVSKGSASCFAHLVALRSPKMPLFVPRAERQWEVPRQACRLPPTPAQTSGGLSDNVAGMLAYFTIIPAIVLLLIEPYSKRRFVRYHAFQSLFFAIACMVASFAIKDCGL